MRAAKSPDVTSAREIIVTINLVDVPWEGGDDKDLGPGAEVATGVGGGYAAGPGADSFTGSIVL